MNVLSVDWDYFFPNSGAYDWGFCESHPFMMEMVWGHRVASRNMRHPERSAVTEMRARGFEGFWEKIQFSNEPMLVIAESHKELHMVLDQYIRADSVINFDAHHDIAYRSNKGALDCGSWASHAFKDKLFKKYELVYPEWRKEQPESNNIFTFAPKKLQENTKVHYGMPNLPKFGAVFICRSSSWTPSWCDDKWLEFIYWWKDKHPFSWETKAAADFVLKMRQPALPEAEKMEKIVLTAQAHAKENPDRAAKIIMEGFIEAQKIMGFTEEKK